MKAGFADDEAPKVCFPSVVGRPKQRGPHFPSLSCTDQQSPSLARLSVSRWSDFVCGAQV
eukprot:1167583-Rhodomonas_salina.1